MAMSEYEPAGSKNSSSPAGSFVQAVEVNGLAQRSRSSAGWGVVMMASPSIAETNFILH